MYVKCVKYPSGTKTIYFILTRLLPFIEGKPIDNFLQFTVRQDSCPYQDTQYHPQNKLEINWVSSKSHSRNCKMNREGEGFEWYQSIGLKKFKKLAEMQIFQGLSIDTTHTGPAPPPPAGGGKYRHDKQQIRRENWCVGGVGLFEI